MSYIHQETFIKVMSFIYQTIDEPLTLEKIATNVGLSVSTLKRLFLQATNSSAGSFIRRLKMERAFRSLKNKEESVLEIALKNGFEDASAFARSFKENFGYSPTNSRNKINIVNELECVTLEEPELFELKEFTIQAITKQGLYFEAAPLAWDALKRHLKKETLGDDFTGAFVGIGHDNPHDGERAEDQVRFSAGVASLEYSLDCEELIIQAGPYAKFTYEGKLNCLGMAYHYIYGAWNNTSKFKIQSKKPAFMMMDTFPDAFKEQVICIYVPVDT